MGGTGVSSGELFANDGAMGDRMRRVDWAASPLGPVENWQQSLKTIVQVMLHSRHPMFVWWGSELIYFYNDAYAPVLGSKHPAALGASAPQVWPEIWSELEPLVGKVIREGRATWADDLALFMHRHGYAEECHFAFSYSPVLGDDGRVAGLFCACTEITAQVLSTRRAATQQALLAVQAGTVSAAAVCPQMLQALSGNPQDCPWAAIYLDGDGGSWRRQAVLGRAADHPGLPETVTVAAGVAAAWPVAAALSSGQSVLVDDPHAPGDASPRGPRPEPARQALVLPLPPQGRGPGGALILGLNPHRELDEAYRDFALLVADHIAHAIARAQRQDEERQRLAAMAELDRAKTVFFSNISHEFRTPLTLLLGPLEEALAAPEPLLTNADLTAMQRNGQRLLKLVNSLLDFSRIESGRYTARYRRTDIAAFTADLAASFGSALQRAGLEFAITVPPEGAEAWVDHDIWEKIVLNLISNAFKHTLAGGITVAVRGCAGSAAGKAIVELEVRDTGTGIPAAERPRIFDRFHRVEHAQARSSEGSGIGLALVQELVKLHGGTISVDSEPGRGSSFTVRIPAGCDHLPGDSLAESVPPTGLRAQAYLDEALRWLPPASEIAGDGTQDTGFFRRGGRSALARVLVVDDNADLRDYISRLLRPRWRVATAADGRSALAAVRHLRPDLLLTDVMMPGLDGHGLLRELRADPELKDLPVIMLSARAGEEEVLAGTAGGADDYVVKPFSARELVAKIAGRLELTRLRRSSWQREKELLEAAHAADRRTAEIIEAIGEAYCELDAELRYVAVNAAARRMVPELADAVGRELFALFPRVRGTPLEQDLRGCLADGRPRQFEYRDYDGRWYLNRFHPTPDGGVAAFWLDITARKQTETALASERDRWQDLAEAMPVLVWTATGSGECDYLSRRWEEYTGAPAAMQLGHGWMARIHPDDRAGLRAAWGQAIAGDDDFMHLHRIRRHDGTWRWFQCRAALRRDSAGVAKWYGSCTDMQELMDAQESLRRSNADLMHFAAIASHDLQEPLRMIASYSDLLLRRQGDRLDAPARGHVAQITGAAVRMRELILALLGYAQLGNERVTPVALPLHDAVADALANLRAQLDASAAVVRIGSLPIVLGDRVLLAQVFQNLIGNAVKFTEPGRAPSIHVEGAVIGAEVVVQVEDDGIGISAVGQRKLFTIFQRLHGRDRYPGSGIGLAACKRIVERHGGRTWIESEPDAGTTVFIALPSASAAPA